jgi:hypothetical protein
MNLFRNRPQPQEDELAEVEEREAVAGPWPRSPRASGRPWSWWTSSS